jgi:hypothetical protein
MKIKCVRCGAKSKMALCNECLPPDLTVQTITTPSVKESLPTRSDVKAGLVVAIDETKQLSTTGRTWLKANFKSLTKYKNWNIAFDKAGLLTLAKDTALAVLPLLILGFISAKFFLSQVPELDSLPTGGITQAAAFWILNFALGIGLTLSGNASVGFITGSGTGTVRLIASGLTVLLAYLLIRKSRARAEQGTFAMNPQSEIVGTAALLSFFSIALTSLKANAFSGSADVGYVSAGGSISISVDFYSLLLGPLIVSAIVVLLGSYAIKNKKKISDALNQSIAFFVGAIALSTIVVVLVALKEREISIIPTFLVLAPTLVLVGLSAISGVPLMNTGGDADSFLTSSNGTPIDITQPTFSLVLYFGLLLIVLLLIGTVMGFRIDPRTYTARNSTRIVLTISGIVLFLNFFFMFYAFGDASGAFGAISNTESMAIFANPLLLLPVSLLWGTVYVFGARYLTPIAAEMAPILVSKVLPKLRISISDYYLQTPEAGVELTPLQKQTQTMKTAKAKSIAKKAVLVGIAFFIITGPANNFISNKVSTPTSAVSGFFDSLADNDAAGALGHLTTLDDQMNKEFLTDKVLDNYLHKPQVTSVEILDSGEEWAEITVEYTLNSNPHTARMSLVRNSENKLFGLFPVWKISQGVLSRVETSSYDGNSVTFGGVAVPTKTFSILLFPGVVESTYEDPIYTKKYNYTLLVDPYDEVRYELKDAALKADAVALIEKLARKSITECNQMTENPQYTCTYYQEVKTTTLDSVENFTVTDIQESDSGYYFTLDFDLELNYTNPSTGITQTIDYHYNRTAYLDRSNSFTALRWS